MTLRLLTQVSSILVVHCKILLTFGICQLIFLWSFSFYVLLNIQFLSTAVPCHSTIEMILCCEGVTFIRQQLASMCDAGNNTTPPEEVNCDKDDDIDSFFVTVQKPTATVSVLEQLNSYLQQPFGDVESLGLFPQLKELFVRLNTPLPASAACERLFSSTGQIFTPKHHHFGCQLRTSAIVEAE